MTKRSWPGFPCFRSMSRRAVSHWKNAAWRQAPALRLVVMAGSRVSACADLLNTSRQLVDFDQGDAGGVVGTAHLSGVGAGG